MYFFQILAVTMCIGGIVLMAYAEGFEGPNAIGVTLSAGAAVGAALYKVSTQTYYFPPPLEKKNYQKASHRDRMVRAELFKAGLSRIPGLVGSQPRVFIIFKSFRV